MKSIKSSFICMLFVLCLTAASKGQAQEFSVVLEEDRNFLLFIFHQDMRLVLIDHSDFPWFKRAHSVDEARAQELTEQLGALREEYRQNEAVLSEEEIRRMNSNAQDLVVQLQLIQEGNDGWVVNYNPSDYDDLLRDELNRVPLNSDQFSYDQDQNQQQLIITNRALVLRARSFLRNNTAFTLAIKTNEGMYWAFYDQVADIEGMAALADQNSFTFCNLIEDIENFERRGYQNKEISGFSAREAMSSRGIACDRNNELLIVDNPSLEEYFIDELVITRTVDKSVICSEGANYRIHLAGTIGPDSSFALSELIDRSTPCLDPQGKIVNPTVVSLSSSGGLLNDGYAMGKAIRDANVTTLIRDGDICASSCAVAYLGGVKRIMQGESYVMFHAPYNVQPSNNLVTRRPSEEPELSVLLNATSADGLDASTFYSASSESIGTTVFASYNVSEAYDPAGINLSAIPEFERWTLSPKLFIYSDDSELMLGVNIVKEDRLGGDMEYIAGDRSRPAYYEDSATLRLSSQLEYSRMLDSGNELVIRNSISRFNRELLVPDFEFSGIQLSSFSEAHLLGGSNLMDWVVGLNLWTEDFDQDSGALPMQIDYDQQTFGLFAQGTRSFSDSWILEAGLRLDRDSDYGEFVLPRLSLLYTGIDDTSIRFGGGLGYKLPTPFSEEAERIQFQDLQPLQINNLEVERSAGVNADINRSWQLNSSLSFDLNLLLFYTRVDDPLMLIPQADQTYSYQQPVPSIDTRGTEMNAVWRWNDYKFFLGYTHADVQENWPNETRDSALIPEDRVNMVFVYEREDDIRVGLEAYYYGQQTLESGSQSPDYWIFGLMTEKIFSEDFSLFLNFENFGDTRQTRDGPIYTGSISNPEFVDIYAPLDGFVINGGVKFSF